MFNVADYLKKFTRIEGESLFQQDTIKSAIYDACGMNPPPFTVKKDILYIKASPVVRSIIYTKKAAILEGIKAKDPKSRITDIR